MGLDAAIVERRLVSIQKEIEFLKKIRTQPEDEFLRDEKSLRASSKSIETIAHSIIDISSHIIAQKKWGVSESYRDAILTLSRKQVIGEELSENLQRMVAMRNILVHQYLETDYEIIWDTIPQLIEDSKEFVSKIRNLFSNRGN